MQTVPVQEELDQIAESLKPIQLDGVSTFVAIVVLVVSIVLARLTRRWILRLEDRVGPASKGLITLGARLAAYTVVLLGVIAALRVLGIDLGPLLAGLGFAAIVLAVALQPFLANLAAGLTLQMQQPISVESQARIAGIEGTIIDMTPRAVTLETPDGEIVYIPNRSVIDDPIFNYSQYGRRRTTIDVGLAYATDLAVAARTMAEAAAATPGVLADPAPEALIHEFGDSTINAAVRFWHSPEILSRWTIRHDVAVNLKRALDDAGIEIAFPQRVVWQAGADA